MKFLGQDFHKLEPKQHRQTDTHRHVTEHITMSHSRAVMIINICKKNSVSDQTELEKHVITT